jgi:hypothetical protein
MSQHQRFTVTIVTETATIPSLTAWCSLDETASSFSRRLLSMVRHDWATDIVAAIGTRIDITSVEPTLAIRVGEEYGALPPEAALSVYLNSCEEQEVLLYLVKKKDGHSQDQLAHIRAFCRYSPSPLLMQGCHTQHPSHVVRITNGEGQYLGS